jgi:hypothetical protein
MAAVAVRRSTAGLALAITTLASASARTDTQFELAGTLFEAGDDNLVELDVERIEIDYLHRDGLRMRVGRFHSAIGYYDDAAHRGRGRRPAPSLRGADRGRSRVRPRHAS